MRQRSGRNTPKKPNEASVLINILILSTGALVSFSAISLFSESRGVSVISPEGPRYSLAASFVKENEASAVWEAEPADSSESASKESKAHTEQRYVFKPSVSPGFSLSTIDFAAELPPYAYIELQFGKNEGGEFSVRIMRDKAAILFAMPGVPRSIVDERPLIGSQSSQPLRLSVSDDGVSLRQNEDELIAYNGKINRRSPLRLAVKGARVSLPEIAVNREAHDETLESSLSRG